MPGKDAIVVNDNLFQKTISCPLKFFFTRENDQKGDFERLFFRQRNKLHIRDAVAHQFKHTCRHTSDSVQEALKETGKWLGRDTTVICGAVICYENFLTRIPILIKESRNLTIVQVQGKLWKKSDGNEIRSPVQNRNILQYLLKAAYRMEVVKNSFPESNVNVVFCFPSKHFESSADNLHLFTNENFVSKEVIDQEFPKLFSSVKATEAVDNIRKNIPASVVHQNFANLSFTEALAQVDEMSKSPDFYPEITRHQGCKYCEFRKASLKNSKGCWDRFFSTEDIQRPGKHIFELIGYGNSAQSENGTFYQEEAKVKSGLQPFEKTDEARASSFTILQRRNLQILQAKGETVPDLWIKPGVTVLRSLKFPFHFLDFEAATYALPMKSGTGPYNPVYFQFSCHTLYENGELIHSEWLDRQHGSVHPHVEFVNQLGSIPDIYKGTIVQYSPFEKQGINRLTKGFKQEPELYKTQIQTLEKIGGSELSGYKDRFFDLSRLIRDYYFNKFFTDGLGLKQVLSGILQWELTLEFFNIPTMKIGDSIIDIAGHTKPGERPDPYRYIQSPDFLIADGSAAMNAWLAMKNGLLTNEEQFRIPEILRKYCALDSFALFVIYQHLEKFLGEIKNKDLIRF